MCPVGSLSRFRVGVAMLPKIPERAKSAPAGMLCLREGLDRSTIFPQGPGKTADAIAFAMGDERPIDAA